jgi:hypothetical protein
LPLNWSSPKPTWSDFEELITLLYWHHDWIIQEVALSPISKYDLGTANNSAKDLESKSSFYMGRQASLSERLRGYISNLNLMYILNKVKARSSLPLESFKSRVAQWKSGPQILRPNIMLSICSDRGTLSEHVFGRRVLETRRGYIGLTHYQPEVGNLMCSLAGCTLPMVLRTVSHIFRFVGEAYVHGIMEGGGLVDKKREFEGRV